MQPEAEIRQEVAPALGGFLPSAVLHLLNGPQPSRTAPAVKGVSVQTCEPVEEISHLNRNGKIHTFLLWH